MNKISLGSKGHFKLEVLRNGVVSKQTATDNVVTYSGAYQSFFGVLMFGALYAAVGTGTTEITRSSSALGNELARSGGAGASRQEVDNLDGTSTVTCTRTLSFPLGSVVGTISEVGLYSEASSGYLVAGQLIKDEFGNPTTLTLLADEQLKVTYTLEFTVPNGEQSVAPVIGSGTVSTPRGSHNYTVYGQPFFSEYALTSTHRDIRGQKALQYVSRNNSSGNLIEVALGTSSGISKNHDGSGTVTVTSPSITAAPNQANASDIKYMTFGGASNNSYAPNYKIDTTTKFIASEELSYGLAVIEFTPAIEKNNTESFTSQFQLTYTV